MLMPAIIGGLGRRPGKPVERRRAEKRQPAERVVMRDQQEADEVVAEMRAHGGAEIAGRVDEQRQQRGEGADRDQRRRCSCRARMPGSSAAP